MKNPIKSQIYLVLILILYLSYSCKKDNEDQNAVPRSIPRSNDLKNMIWWKLASTPQHRTGSDMFPEGAPGTGLDFRKNAARLAWYNIDPIFSLHSPLLPPNITPDELSNHFVRGVRETEIWHQFYPPGGQPFNVPILNMVYYPAERGPYNYDAIPTSFSMGMNSDGSLANPASRWGGITRNIEKYIKQLERQDNVNEWTIDFILMDPFVYDPDHSGGDLYIHLGLVSEDILRDGRASVESGLPTSHNVINVDTTIWGRVSTNSLAPLYFSNEPLARPYQDVGLDGLRNEDERLFFIDNFLSVIANLHGTSSLAYQLAFADPSADDYQYFRSSELDLTTGSILERYRRFNGMDGNSPTAAQAIETYPVGATITPDREDFSNPGTLQETESYFQYKISLRPEDMVYDHNYIKDIRHAQNIALDNGARGNIHWYYFSIPIHCPDKEIIGGAPSVADYKFIRVIFKNFEQTIVCRFAAFQIVVDEESRPTFWFPLERPFP